MMFLMPGAEARAQGQSRETTSSDSAAATAPTQTQALAMGCITASCHAGLLSQTMPHPIAETCDLCHQRLSDAHPQASTKTFQLTQAMPALCYQCHDKIQEQAKAGMSAHKPIQTEASCATCHAPHAGAEGHLLKKPSRELCLGCHAGIIPKSPQVIHDPVRSGSCAVCHDPHAAPNQTLLRKSYAKMPYAVDSEGSNQLCFTCHAPALINLAVTNDATGFRDGDRNLHHLHGKRGDRGKSCSLCHAVHASTRPRLIADTVPFGNWMMPIRFEKNDSGGSCAPGCHQKLSYDRNSGARGSVQETNRGRQ